MSLIDRWSEIVDCFCGVLKKHPRLVCNHSVSRDWVEEYLAFYAVNGGLFLSFVGNTLCGLMTMHPGAKDQDFEWDSDQEGFTVSMLWAESKKALRDLMIQGFLKFKCKKVFACRDGHVVEMPSKKLTRLLNYGQKA